MNQLLGVRNRQALGSEVLPGLTLIDVLPVCVFRDIGPFLIAHCVHPLSKDGRLLGGRVQPAARTVTPPPDNPTAPTVDTTTWEGVKK